MYFQKNHLFSLFFSGGLTHLTLGSERELIALG